MANVALALLSGIWEIGIWHVDSRLSDLGADRGRSAIGYLPAVPSGRVFFLLDIFPLIARRI